MCVVHIDLKHAVAVLLLLGKPLSLFLFSGRAPACPMLPCSDGMLRRAPSYELECQLSQPRSCGRGAGSRARLKKKRVWDPRRARGTHMRVRVLHCSASAPCTTVQLACASARRASLYKWHPRLRAHARACNYIPRASSGHMHASNKNTSELSACIASPPPCPRHAWRHTDLLDQGSLPGLEPAEVCVGSLGTPGECQQLEGSHEPVVLKATCRAARRRRPRQLRATSHLRAAG